jgi:hypothetical protein
MIISIIGTTTCSSGYSRSGIQRSLPQPCGFFCCLLGGRFWGSKQVQKLLHRRLRTLRQRVVRRALDFDARH